MESALDVKNEPKSQEKKKERPRTVIRRTTVLTSARPAGSTLSIDWD